MTAEHKAENAAIATKVGSARFRTWQYHMAHIYKTMGVVIEETLGQPAREAVFAKADRRLAERYGESLVELMHIALMIDFWVTPSVRQTRRLTELFA